MSDRKELRREYKESARPAGVYCVRNTVTGTSLVGDTPNLPGMLNRQRFQLEMGSHPDKQLQADWNDLGDKAFDFVVLDRLEGAEDVEIDTAEELSVLRDMWLERLAEAGTPLYPTSTRTSRRR